MTDMRSILGAMAERNKMEPGEIPEGTYRADDGLLHCKVCDQPVQHRLDIGGTVHLVRCICRCDEERRKREEEEERQRRERMYIASLKANGIQEQHFYSWTFANAEQNGDIRMAQRYVSQWEKAKEQNLGLLLWGGVGTGKTYIAACIANALIEQKVPVLMTNFSKVLNQMGAMYSEDRYKYISDFSKFPLLIIDDLGVERSTEYVREQIFAIMFLLTFLIMNTGMSKQELDNNIFQASSIAQKHNCNLRRLDFQQEQALMSSLPLAMNQIEIERGMTTSSTAIFVPFTTQELFQDGKGSLYYGLNALSNNLIMVDRKLLKNPNGLILGTPGSGKSFSAKREITNAFLVTDDDIIICDPEAEYSPLVNRLKGQVIKISPTSTHHINPMDINSNYSEEDNPLALKADFILSLCELIVGGKEGLQPVEKTVIDRCVHQVYQNYFDHPTPENMPVLEDLYNLLLTQEEKEARHVATALEIYVKGSLNLFNHRTNVDISNRLVCYDIKELGKQLKKLGMLIVQDQVWGRVTANREAGRATRYYMDEFHLLLKEEQTAAYSVEIWKRFRKWGGIPTGITQNVKDLLSSREVENIFENSDFIYMLNQAQGDRQILAKQLNISPHQLSYVTHSGEGEGLLFYGMKDLRRLASEASRGADGLFDTIHAKDARLEEIHRLKNHIFNYSKTKDIYEEYRRTGYDPLYLEEHAEEIQLHEQAKAAFDQQPNKKIPKVKDLNAEYGQVIAEKKKVYAEYRMARNKAKELQIALKNAEIILEEDQEQTKKRSRKNLRDQSH